uniref:Uncharacterized protein n=1 Tax=uncultured bacterium W5-102b TaxID=1130996 RepID=H9BWJ8_9BACT|nr:hypothetical protein [uncultured bacterium W5-102b]
MTNDVGNSTSPATGTPALAPVGDPTEPHPVETDSFSQLIGGAVRKGELAAIPSAAWGVPAAGVAGFAFVSSEKGLIRNLSPMGRVGALAGKTMPKLTPALIFGIAGPGIADAVSMVLPNIVKPYKKDMSTKDKDGVKIQRGSAAGVATTGVAAAVWWKKPDLFTNKNMFGKFVGGISDVDVTLADGSKGRALPKWMPESMSMRKTMKIGNSSLAGVAKSAGGIAVAGLAGAAIFNAVRGDVDGAKDWASYAGLGVFATMAVAGVIAMKGKPAAAHGVVAGAGSTSKIRLPQLSPEFIKWIKSFATIAAPLSVVPAASAAYNHYDVQDAFGNLVNGKKKRAPTRKTTK